MKKGFKKLEMWRSARKYLVFILPLFFAIFSFNNVSAAMTLDTDLYKKSLLMGVNTCYEMYAKDSIQIKDFENYLSVFNKNSGFANVSSSDIWITTHVGNSLNTSYYNDSNFSCKQVFEGYGSSAKGLKDFYTMPTTLEGMGYQFSSVILSDDENADEDGSFWQLTFSIERVTDDSGNNQNPVMVTGEGVSCIFVKKTKAWMVTECNGETGISYNGEQLMNLVGNGSENLTIETVLDVSTAAITIDILNTSLYWIEQNPSHEVRLVTSFGNSAFHSNLEDLTSWAVSSIYTSPSVIIKSFIPNRNTTENQNATYTPAGDENDKDKDKAAKVFINKIKNSDLWNTENNNWTPDDMYSLYYKYLLDIKKNYPEISINQCSAEKPASGYAFKNSPTEWCIINIPPSETGAMSETVSVFSGSGNGSPLAEGTFGDVLSWLSDENNYAGVSTDAYANASVDENGNLVPDGSEEESTEEVTCLSSGAAGSLGWIVCSLIDWFGDVAQDFYTNAIEDNLQVDPILFTGGDGGTKQAWETFRTIANIAFIVVFLAVIFSQLTGVGIDNYGIKKILPKLIVAAILINLSYWLCIALVDVSNILGYSLQRMFNGLAENLKVVSSVIPGSAVLPTIASVAILGILAGSAIWSGGAIVFTLLISALGVVVSIAFLFVLLSVRQAVIVVLVATSPLAVIAYILPNTKKTLFDKWWKLLKSQLLVYPIIGLLVGGGNYVSKLLLASGIGDQGVFSAATAMVTGVAPIFFIPTVLKNSMTAMGTLGTKLSGMGRTASGYVTKKATNSELNKGIQERGMQRRTRLRAGIDKNGQALEGTRGRISTILAGGQRSKARARAQYLRDVDAHSREQDLLGTGFESSMANLEAKADNQMVAGYESLLNNGKVNGVNVNDADAMGAYHRSQLAAYRNAVASGDVAGQAAAMAQIKAAQNIMSKTDKGRTAVGDNLASALRNGDVEGLAEASSHLMSAFGDTYKAKNRGEHAMINDLATKDLTDSTTLSSLQGKLDTVNASSTVTAKGAYSMAGTDKYDEETLAGADERTLDNFVDAIANDNLTGADLDNLQGTVYKTLLKAQANDLSLKPEVEAKLRKMLPSAGPSGGNIGMSQIVSCDMWKDKKGNTKRIFALNNGTYVNGSGKDETSSISDYTRM